MTRKKPPHQGDDLPLLDLILGGEEGGADADGAVHKKLRIDPAKLDLLRGAPRRAVEVFPRLTLPTRWEYLEPRIEANSVSLKTIIRPVQQAMNVVGELVEYLRTTGGCQILVIRADTGSGKTTFLNTLPLYMSDVEFHKRIIDLQTLNEDEFQKTLWETQVSSEKINLIILEGREKPESITDRYVQIVVANINRFAREKRVPMLFVIPTIEEQVARSWCEHGSRVGDLIPQQRLYDGSRWYNFPGVPRSKYVEIAEETVRALNPPYSLMDFGVSSDELRTLAETASTVGKFIEILAARISDRRSATAIENRGQREHVWIVYCSPDNRHYDHTWLVIDGYAQDEKLKLSPVKLVPSDSDTPLSKYWRKSDQWPRLVATINFLDIRLINLPITTVVTAALTYGDDELLNSFKETPMSQYREQIPRDMWNESIDWEAPLAKRRLQVQNARDSLERSNLFRLLKGLPAEQQKGGVSELAQSLAQYLHLRSKATESDLHYYLGLAMKDLLGYQQFPGFAGVETESPLVRGQTQPVPDVTVYTTSDVYALEFHFLQQQIAASQVAQYAIKNVIEKYMRSLPHLNSVLENMK